MSRMKSRNDIPCIRALTQQEVEEAYEANTGKAIVEGYADAGLKPLEFPGALLSHHGPFSWGKTAMDAASNALIMESVAKMAQLSLSIAPGLQPVPEYITRKHYLRKHGPGAYYGQTKH